MAIRAEGEAPSPELNTSQKPDLRGVIIQYLLTMRCCRPLIASLVNNEAYLTLRSVRTHPELAGKYVVSYNAPLGERLAFMRVKTGDQKTDLPFERVKDS